MGCQVDCPAILLQLLVYGVVGGSIVALNAVGFSLVYAVAHQVNLAQGNVFTFCTVVVVSAAGALGMTTGAPFATRLLALAFLATIGAGVGAAANTLVERLAFRPFAARRDTVAPLIATMGLSFVLV